MDPAMAWLYLFAGIGASFLCVFLIAERYRLILVSLGERFSQKESIFTTSVSQISSYLIPVKVSSFTTRPLAAKFFAGASLKKATVAATFDQVFEIGWEIVSLPFMLILVSGWKTAELSLNIIFLFAAVALVALVMSRPEKVFYFLWRFKSIVPRRVKRFLSRRHVNEAQIVSLMKESSSLFSNRKLVLKVVIVTVLSLVIFPLMLLFPAYFLGGSMDYTTAFLIFWISTIIGRLSGIPGGFVTKDVTMLGLLNLYGMDMMLSLAVIFAYRIVSILPNVVLGVPPLIMKMKAAGKSMRDGNGQEK
jgi:uncharacterized protein (TIRG00374 family)